MGGFFRAPKMPAPVYTAPSPAKDPDAEARKQRQEAISRNRRGRFGLINTSNRGLLEQAVGDSIAPSATGKTMLGE